MKLQTPDSGLRTLPGDCARKYRVESLIGEGAYGEVYRAIQVELERPVALKVLRAGRSDDAVEVQRFLSEARVTAGLSHENIVIVLDFGHEEVPWIAYEFLPGPSLARLAGQQPMPIVRALRACLQVAHALDHAHAHDVLHRDVKPDNVVEVERDRYKVGDFGIAKWSGSAGVRTRTGLVVGSPAYIAPEQIAGSQASARSDVYALGITLYELLAGRTPFDGSNIMDVLQGHLSGAIPPLAERVPDLPASVERAVRDALQREPKRRTATAAALAQQLAAALQEVESGPPRRPGLAKSSGRMRVHAGDSLSGATQVTRVDSKPGSGTQALEVAPGERRTVVLLAAVLSAALAVAGLAALAWRASHVPPPARVESVSFASAGCAELRFASPLPEGTTAEAQLPGPRTLEGVVDRAAGRIAWAGLPPRARALVRVTAGERVLCETDFFTPDPLRVDSLDWLSDQRSLLVHAVLMSRTPSVLEVLEGPKVLASRAHGAEQRVLHEHFTEVAGHPTFTVRVRPEHGWGDATTVAAHLQDNPEALSIGAATIRKVALRDATAGVPGQFARALSVEGSDAVVLDWWAVGRVAHWMQRLVEVCHALPRMTPLINRFSREEKLTRDDVVGMNDLQERAHDAQLAERWEKAVTARLPRQRPALVRMALSAPLEDGVSLARSALATDDEVAQTYQGDAMELIARTAPASPELCDELARALAKPPVRHHQMSARALVLADRDRARSYFMKWLTEPQRSDLGVLAAVGLAQLGEDRDADALAQMVGKDSHFGVRKIVALRLLADLDTLEARRALARAVAEEPNLEQAIWSAGRAGLVDARPVLERVLVGGLPRLRAAAAASLANVGDPACAPALVRALADPDLLVRRNAAWALGQLRHVPAKDALQPLALSDADETGVAAWALGRIGAVEAVPDLLKLLERLSTATTPPERARAGVVAYALRLIGDPRATDLLDRLAAAKHRDLLQMGAGAAPPLWSTRATLFVQFPFIPVVRTGIRLKAGQAVTVRTDGEWTVDEQEGHVVFQMLYRKAVPVGMRQGVELGQRECMVSPDARTFVAAVDTEVVLNPVPDLAYHDMALNDTHDVRGLSFVSLELEEAPAPARE